MPPPSVPILVSVNISISSQSWYLALNVCVGHDATGSCINTSRRREVNFALRRSAGYSMERTSEPVGYDGELPESQLDIRGVVTRKFQTPLSKIEFHHSLIVTCTEIFTGNQPSQC